MESHSDDKPAKKKRKYTVVNADVYGKMLIAFREKPRGFTYAAKKAGVDLKTAKRAWELGWPKKGEWARPIHIVLSEEQKVARARIEQEAEKRMAANTDMAIATEVDRERARQDALRARKEEADMVRFARSSASHLVGALASMGPAAVALGQRIRKQILQEMADDTLSRAAGERALRTIGLLAKDVMPLVEIQMRTERLHLGEPTEIIGHVTEFDTMSYEDLAKEIEGGTELLKKAGERGLICLEGGKTGTEG